jgi:hypothetical protein
MLVKLRGARHPVDVCLAPTEAERRLHSNGAICESNEWKNTFSIFITLLLL